MSGNLASLPLIVVPAICKEQNNPFGDEVVCHIKRLAYASLSMAVGYTYAWSIAFNVFRLYLPKTPINEVKVDEFTVKTMSEKKIDPENLLKCSCEALVLVEDISKPNSGMDQSEIECKVANGQAQISIVWNRQEREMAPGRCSTWMNRNCNGGDSAIEPYLVSHHQLLAHATTVHVYKTKYQELNKIKKQVDNAEATKAKAISELESAKEILQNLITKLANVKLTEATKRLQDIAEEKNSIKKLMFCLRKYLNQVQKEQGEVKEKKHAAEAIAANLTVELQNSREESRPEPFTAEDLEADIF
ncbi:hypothetical protein Fmac_026436 [Flemingia macrophylla]|uniref:Uncharacterized protein n=1 Tax=Flemingia macrophylla TaxID=520843 RepID=A0ABD1LEV9_9FABA